MSDVEIKGDAFRNAVIRIERRAERQIYDERLVKTFVPNKVLDELQTPANQLVFGRRGVGKTHTLKAYLGQTIQAGGLCHYLDCTSFGSGLSADGTPKNVGIRFFSKLISELANELLEDAARVEIPSDGQHDKLESIIYQLTLQASPNLEGETFNYGEISRLLTSFLDSIGADRLYLLIDEWAQIPVESQPYFAEFVKRAIFSNNRITTKIGVVDFAYRLGASIGDTNIGLEKSADIFSDVKMDRFFVWDQDEDFVERFFAEVLYNHLAVELGIEVDLSSEEKSNWVMKNLFTQRKVFSELCRASEGNTRDFLILFGKAHAYFRKQDQWTRIGQEDVSKAAVDLYRSDKLSNIASEERLEDFLEHLVHEIIREKKARTFMVPYQHRQHPLLSRLYSARILHPLDVEWSHPHKAGERYSLVTMDYGTYVTLRNTKSEPDQQVFWPIDSERKDELELVPLDDRKSIRHIVVEKSVLDRFSQ